MSPQVKSRLQLKIRVRALTQTFIQSFLTNSLQNQAEVLDWACLFARVLLSPMVESYRGKITRSRKHIFILNSYRCESDLARAHRLCSHMNSVYTLRNALKILSADWY